VLDRRLRELSQLVDVFAAADGAVVEKAVQATSAMTPLEDCADVARLTATIEPPDAATAKRVDELRTDLGRAKALSDAGKYKDALAIAKQVTDAARGTKYKPVLAEALALLGEIDSYVAIRRTPRSRCATPCTSRTRVTTMRCAPKHSRGSSASSATISRKVPTA